MVPPNIALLNAQIQEICDQLRIAKEKSNWEWFTKRGIDVSRATNDDYWLFSKITNFTDNHWNKLCVGLVLKTEGGTYTLASLPIIRLHNTDSKECCVNYANSDLVQKIGGERVTIFWPYQAADIRIYHTDKAISTVKKDIHPKSVLRKAKSLLSGVNFSDIDRGNCYTLQIVNDKVYIVGGRHVFSLFEHTEEELDVIGQKLGLERPLKVKCDSANTVRNLMKSTKDVFIIRDRKTGERANVHMQISRPKRIAKGSYKRLLPFWCEGTHRQIMEQFPESCEKYAIIDHAAATVKVNIRKMALQWTSRLMSPEGLAKSLKFSAAPTWSYKIITRLQKFNPERWDDVMNDWLHKMQARQLMEILELED